MRTDAIIGLMGRLHLANVNAIVSLCTNGMIADGDLKRLLRYDNIEWRISLDTPSERYSEFDCRTGFDFERVFNTIRAVIAHDRPLVIRSTVTKQNMFLMDELVQKCEHMGVKKIMFTPMRFAYGRSLNMRHAMPDADEYIMSWFNCRSNTAGITVTDSHFEMIFGKGHLYCPGVFVMPDGIVLPTIAEAYVQKRLHIGNIAERDWLSFETKLNGIKSQFFLDVEENCQKCIGRHICGGGAMATELYLGTNRQGMECSYLQRMVTEACKRINPRLPKQGENILTDVIPGGVCLLDYKHLKSKI